MILIEYEKTSEISGSGITLLKEMIVMPAIIKHNDNLSDIFHTADAATDIVKDDPELVDLLNDCLIEKERKIYHD